MLKVFTESSKILIAVGDSTISADLKQVLGNAGYQIIEAASGNEILRSAQFDLPEMILLDAGSSGEDGIETCRRIKSDPALARTLVVIITNRRTGSDNQTTQLNCGADGYISWPVPSLDLLSLIQTLARLKKAERELENLRRFQTDLVQQIGEGLVIDNLEGRFTFVNQAGATMLGYEVGELLGKHWSVVVQPKNRPVVQEMIEQRLQGLSNRYELDLLRKDGTLLPVQVSGCPRHENGQLSGTMAILTDISGIKRRQEIMQVRLRLMEYAATHSLTEILQETLDEVGQLVDSPLGFLHFVTPDQATITPQAWSTLTMQSFGNTMPIGQSFDLSNAGVWADCIRQKRPVVHNDNAFTPSRRGLPAGHAPFHRELVVPILREDKIVAILGVGNKPVDYTEDDVEIVACIADVAWDIAENIRTVEALRESEGKFKYIFDHSVTGMSLTLPDGRRQANAAFCTMLGYLPEEISNIDSHQLTYPDDVEETDKTLNAMLSGEKETARFIKRYVHKKGSAVWADIGTALRRDKDGNPLYFYTTATDITTLKTTEQELREALNREKFLGDIIRNASVAIGVGYPNGRLGVCNPAFEKLIGYTEEELRKVSWSKTLTPPEWRSLERKKLRELRHMKKTVVYEKEYIRKDGQRIQVEVLVHPVMDEQGEVIHYYGFLTDISERKKSQDKVQQVLDRQIALNRMGIRLGSTFNLDEICEIAYQEVQQSVKNTGFSINLYNETHKTIHPVLAIENGVRLAADQKRPWCIAHGQNPDSCAILSKECKIINGLQAAPTENQKCIYPDNGHLSLSGSILTAPMLVNETVIGTVQMRHQDIDIYSPEDAQVLSSVANLVALSIHNARLYQEAQAEIAQRKQAEAALRKQNKYQLALQETTLGLVSQLDVNSLLENIVQRAGQLMDTQSGFLDLIDHTSGQLVSKIGLGVLAVSLNYQLHPGEGVAGVVWETGKGFFVNDYYQWPGHVQSLRNNGIRAVIGVPLFLGDRFQGVLGLAYSHDQLDNFTEADIAILTEFARLAAIALENARLYQTVQAELKYRLHAEEELRNHRNNLENLVRERTRELENAKEMAEAASRAKSDFLAVMSHEIRTPLNGILGMAHLTQLTNLSEKQQNYLSHIQASGEVLLATINNILDFSKIEAGKMALEAASFNLDEVLQNLASLMAFRAQEKGLELIFDMDPNLPVSLIGDQVRLGQVLLNLTGNAIKFAEQGEVIVKIEMTAQNLPNIKIRFSVIDTGIGMTKEQVASLFEPFSQADTSTTRKYGGTGLGLTISQRLVNIMGGEIIVSSEIDKGSTFAFEVDLEQQLDIKENLSSHIMLVSRPLRVLLIDDNSSVLGFLDRTLTAHTCQTTTANTLSRGLDLLGQMPYDFDIIMLDWDQVSPTDEAVTLQRIMAQSRSRRMPVVLFACSEQMARVTARRNDLVYYLVKPITRSRLLESINKILTHDRPKHDTLPVQKHQASRHPLLDRSILLVEDNETNQFVANEMLRSMGAQTTIASNGSDALKILAWGSFDAILMDIQMPDMDGYEVTARIRSNERLEQRNTPIIAMTAHALGGEREKALRAGLNDYIAKPIDIHELERVLIHWMVESASVSTEKIVTESNQPDTEYLLDFEAAKQRLGDPVVYQRVTRRFCEEQFNSVTLIREALGAGDEGDAQRLAHTLKGLAGTIGANALAVSAEELESALTTGKPALYSSLLDETDKLLARTIESLPVGDEQKDGPPAVALAQSSLEDLGRLLQDSDAQALTVLQNIIDHTFDPNQRDHLIKVQTSLRKYDFESAFRVLQSAGLLSQDNSEVGGNTFREIQ